MLLEQIIANDPTLQPYEYINTEIAEDGQRLILHLASRKDTAEERCPYCKGHVAYPWQPEHEAEGHAGLYRDEAGSGDRAPSLQMPELRKDILRGDTIQVSRDKDK